MPVPTITAPASPRVIAVDKSIPTLSISATNTPTSYAASPLPAGISVNTSTGQITGTPTVAGTTTTTVTATNGSGTSSPVYIIWEVQDAAVGAGAWSDLELDFDLVTREVTIPEVEKQADDVVVTLLTRDSINLLVGFKKWGQLIDVSESANIARVSFSLKEFEPEQVIALAKESVDLVGSGSTSRYRLPLSIDRQQWDLLSSYEDDAQTSVRAIGSIELEIAYTGYDQSEEVAIATIQAGTDPGDIAGTVVFTGMDTSESPLAFELNMTLAVTGRPNQTVQLSRTFTATWSGGAWVISALSGTSTDSGSVESPWQVSLENTGVTGDSNSVDIAYEITTDGTAPVGDYQWLILTGGVGIPDLQDEASTGSFAGTLYIKDESDTLIGSEAISGSGVPSDFFAAVETAWDAIMGTTGEVSAVYASSSDDFWIVATGASLARYVAYEPSGGSLTYITGTYLPDYEGAASATLTTTLSSDPTDPLLRFSSQPFFTRVIRDWLD